MKTITTFFLFLVCPFAFSQTTITKAFNDPVVGDNVNNQQVTGTVNNTGSGANVTYDNSALTGGGIAVLSYSTPSAGDITSYPGTTIKSTDGTNSTYLKQSATTLEMTGAVISAGTLNFSADNATIMTYPLSYGNTSTDNAKGSFTTTLANGLLKGTVTVNADATGTLLLAANTYNNILRVKITQNFNLYQSSDTNYVFPIGTLTGTTYQYYNMQSKFPLLTYAEGNISVPLLGINQNSSDATAQAFTFLAANNFSSDKIISLYPNPAENFIYLKMLEETGKTSGTIYNMEGKLIKQVLLKNNVIDISDLSAGEYLLRIENKNIQQSMKFIKK